MAQSNSSKHSVCQRSTEALNHSDVARIISEETSRNVRYQPISPEAWRAQLEARADTEDSPVNRAMAQSISTIGAALAGGAAPRITPDAETLAAALGHPAARFVDFVREHRDASSEPAA
jgi:hypothetical protein